MLAASRDSCFFDSLPHVLLDPSPQVEMEPEKNLIIESYTLMLRPSTVDPPSSDPQKFQAYFNDVGRSWFSQRLCQGCQPDSCAAASQIYLIDSDVQLGHDALIRRVLGSIGPIANRGPL